MAKGLLGAFNRDLVASRYRSRNPRWFISGLFVKIQWFPWISAHRITTSGESPVPISDSVKLGKEVTVHHPELVNLYGCEIGDYSKIGAFVEVQKGAFIGKNCKISSHSFICEGVTIEDGVFVGHGVVFINDLYPRATRDGRLQTEADWKVVSTRVREDAAIGSGAVILCGITIGRKAMIGAGAVVTRDVPEYGVVAGVPARLVRTLPGQAL